MADKERAIAAGTFHPFTGPINDQSGKQRVASGKVIDENELRSIDWMVEGVQGNLPR